MRALGNLDRPWETGPFAEPARQLLSANSHGLEGRFHEYDELSAHVRGTSASWVITHGEPHRANVIRGPRGHVHLVEWDTTLLAPRERDLRMVLDDEYVAVAGPTSLNQEAIELYRSWWDLADIGTFISLFRRPHERTEDTTASWGHLTEYLQSA